MNEFVTGVLRLALRAVLVVMGLVLFLSLLAAALVLALAWAVTVGGVLQLAYQLPHLKKIGMLVLPRINLKDAGAMRVIKQMGPAILGVSVSQISLIINTIFASFLVSGSVSWMYYADRLMEFPSGVLGVALAVFVVGEDHLGVAYFADDQDAGAVDGLVVGLGEGVVVGHHQAVDLFLERFEGFAQTRPVGAAGLAHGGGEQLHRVVTLGGSRGHGDSIDAPGAAVFVDEGLAARRVAFLNEGLRHAGAFGVGAGLVDEVGHRQGPAAHQGHLPVEPKQVVGQVGQLGPEAVGEDDLGPGGAGAGELRGHVHVADVEALDGHRLDAVAVEGALKVFTAELAVVGAVVEDRQLAELPAHDGLLDDHRCLDGVGRRDAEDVVVGVLGRQELLGDHRAGGHRGDHRDVGLLVEALAGQRDAGVDDAEAGHDLLAVDELLHHHGATLRPRLVVPLDELHRPPEDPAGVVDLPRREPDAVAHRDPHRARPAGEGAGDADADGLDGRGCGGNQDHRCENYPEQASRQGCLPCSS